MIKNAIIYLGLVFYFFIWIYSGISLLITWSGIIIHTLKGNSVTMDKIRIQLLIFALCGAIALAKILIAAQVIITPNNDKITIY